MSEFKALTDAEIEKLSPEEREAYRLAAYLYETDNDAALKDLEAAIDARQQGYGEVWPTGFDRLDAMLDGGFMGEQLIILGAISSLGKTSFALQIAAQIAEQERDVLVFSLEMSKNELNAKTVSRYSHILTQGDRATEAYRLTTRDILSGRTGTIMGGMSDGTTRGEVHFNAFEAARSISKYMYIVVGENDISVDQVRDYVSLHIRATGRRPFVVLDYMQILEASENAETRDKRLLTDYDVTRLKVVSRDFHIPILAISAFNRTSYLEPVSMGSFRESSGIEYSSDILLAMQYQGMEYYTHSFKDKSKKLITVYESTKEHNTRVRELHGRLEAEGAAGHEIPIELKVLKNRNGKRGTLYYHFLPAYNYYEERETSTYKYRYVRMSADEYDDEETPGFTGKVLGEL